MSQAFTTGPVHIYLGISSVASSNFAVGLGQILGSVTPLYLGTMLDAPIIRFTKRWSPVMNDLAGDQEPYDMAYQGQSADIFGDLTVWNWPVLRLARTTPNPNQGSEGADLAGAIGSLMITEGFAYPIWVDYPYYRQKAAYSSGGAGYRFVAGWMIGPEEERPGTKPNMIHVQLHCQRAPAPSPDGNGMAFVLYDHDMSRIPNNPPVGQAGV